MNYNDKGMDPDFAKKAMEKIIAKKAELANATSTANSNINDVVSKAFSGQQVGAMQGFVGRINEALQELYNYLDGKDSSFAQTLNDAIASYETSDTTVASDYSSANVQ